MPLNAIAIGILAAIGAVLLDVLHRVHLPVSWSSPLGAIGVTAAAVLLQRWVLDRRAVSQPYDGVADLLLHVHKPSESDASLRLGVRSLISALLFLFGGHVGAEGPIIEGARALTHRFRSPGARWFEQRRRTDASFALAAGLAAVFQAPFAAFLVPLELGLGGRGLTVGLAALVSFAVSRLLRMEWGLPVIDYTGTLYGAKWWHWGMGLLVLVLPVAIAAISSVLISVWRYLQGTLVEQFRSQAWARAAVAGVALVLAYWFYFRGATPLVGSFEDLIWGRLEFSQVVINGAVGVLVLALVIAGFGTAGLFWPLFALGATVGVLTARPLMPLVAASGSQAGWLGAAGLWGAVLGLPLAGSVLVFELTGSVETFLVALVVAEASRWLRHSLMKSPSLIEAELAARDLQLSEGRARQILDSLFVKDAMVQDHEVVLENEPVSDLLVRHARAKYPFFPVVNSQGHYTGMLTLDGPSSLELGSSESLAKLLEAKDLLYREGRRLPAIKEGDRLSATHGMFESIPCVAVVSEEGRVVGLLFVHQVRMAYDRELARRTLV